MRYNDLLRMEHIYKVFPGGYALNNVEFSLLPGEVHSIVGENGAGKTTLMNILMGILRADEGQIYLNGISTHIASPSQAANYGIGMVPQELNVIPEFSVAENIFLGSQNQKYGVIDWKTTYDRAEKIMQRLGCNVDVRAKAKNCSVADLQIVQIGRALSFDAKILILDEPTSSLAHNEIQDLFRVIRQLRDDGCGIIFISHHMDEVEELSDRVTILRDGKKIDTTRMSETSIPDIIDKMAGQKVLFTSFTHGYDRAFASDDIILEVDNLTLEPSFRNVSFNVKRGEILGIAGQVGAGRTTVMRVLYGDLKPDSGTIRINGRKCSFNGIRDAMQAGISYMPEERRQHAIFPDMSVHENLTIPSLGRESRTGFKVDIARQKNLTEDYMDRLRIKVPSIHTKMKSLSGGNQQKIIFGRCIEQEQDMIILDEPTRGIDVHAKDEIHRYIERLARDGKTIIVVSSESKELIDIADRIMVMNHGRVSGFVDPKESSPNEILGMALR